MDRYRDQVITLSAHAESEGRLSYSEILQRVYPEGSLTEGVWEAKGLWREQWAHRYLFVSDYDTVDVPVSVRKFNSSRNHKLGSTLVARYEARGHIVRISSSASHHTVLHEVGHSLQREALLETPFAKTAFVSASYQGGEAATGKRDEKKAMILRRLEYLSSQDELEVRLQDLNRFFAICVAGRPILDPIDALDALTVLGMPISKAERIEVLSGTDWESMAGSQRESGYDRVDVKDVQATFEDAAELLLLRRLMHGVDESLWTKCLQKIVFEAPGHL